jgi:hypothetical protein
VEEDEEEGEEGTTRVRGSGPKVRNGDVYGDGDVDVDMFAAAARFGISNVPSVSATRRALCVCAVPLVGVVSIFLCVTFVSQRSAVGVLPEDVEVVRRRRAEGGGEHVGWRRVM